MEQLVREVKDPGGLFKKYQSHLLNTGKPYEKLPKNIEIELTSACNLKCVMCSSYLRPRVPLSKEILLKLFEEVSEDAKKITLQGGEPFLHPELLDITDSIFKKGFQCTIFTNGTILNKSVISNLVENNCRLILSLDGSCPEVHDSIRKVPGTFNKLMDFIDYVKYLRSDIPKFISFNLVIQNENIKDILNYFELINKLGGRYIHIEFLSDLETGTCKPLDRKKLHWLRKNQTLVKEKLIENNLSCNASFFDWLSVLQDEQVFEDVVNLQPAKTLNKISPINCYLGSHYSFINCYGDVYPCCEGSNTWNPRNPLEPFGNIYKQNIIEIWNSSKWNSFRKNTCPINFQDNRTQVCAVCQNYFDLKAADD